DAKIALLKKDLGTAKAAADNNAAATAALQSSLKVLSEEKAAWEKEKASLQARLAETPAAAKIPKPSTGESSRIKQVEKERDAKIALLQKDLSSAKAAAESNALAMKGLESALKSAREEKSALEKEKAAWQAKVTAPAVAVKPGARESSRVKQLEDEREELLKKLNAAAKELYDSKARGESSQAGQLTTEMAALRARLDVYEAKKAPFTPEELALFKTTPLVAESDPNAGKKPSKELPAGAGVLVAEAQRAFAARRYDEAEKKYLQVLKLDERNVFTLANLAAIQMEQNRLEDAEANLKLALREDANDAYSLSLMGILKFRLEKYDEALDTLSRAAQLDPKNPETQNYLGITLSQKGQRGPAEAALRKAVQLAPGYGGAHHNLAVIYATQQPPFLELARWHYQKALDAGHAENPELEKLLNPSKAPPGNK
ncbi:MAG: tetratricopeptide repeat protein, partial [Chloroflexi bacterium]|nr:tetratricopeptide repeat protein [Chloroflexota bacterium]